jgi:CheY-like chemotaxis protein
MNGPVLYVENDENDIFLFHRALKRIGFPHPFVAVKNGREALSYLQGHEPFVDRQRYPLPVLLVLDLKMPELSGIDVLRWVREQTTLAALPVLLFSSSTQATDIVEARRLGANAYAVKPGTPQQLEDMLKAVRDEVFAHHQERSLWNIEYNQCLSYLSAAAK